MENKEKINPRFYGNFIIKGKIKCLTGIHVGGSKEKLDIGGVDSPVVRNPRNNLPYIPGSSLKGKMRHLLELSLGKVNIQFSSDGKAYGDVSMDPEIVRIFGIGANEKEKPAERPELNGIGPSRLIVRDCNPHEETIKMWKEMDSELLFTEYKAENTIDRLTSAANPRFIERVVEGSEFDFEMIYAIYKMTDEETNDNINRDLKNILKSLRLIEHSAIGKSGSRGYGKVKFYLAQPIKVLTEDYREGTQKYKDAELVPENLMDLSQITEIFY